MVHLGLPLAIEVLNALATQIAVLDANGVIVSVNAAWSRFANDNDGMPDASAYVGTNYLAVCREAAHRGDASAGAALTGMEEVLRGDREAFSLEYPCNAPERKRWFRMSVTRFAVGAEHYLVAAHDEITTQKQHEQSLEESERLLRSVLETLPIGVWILGADGQIVQGNPAGVRIWAGARFVGPEEFGQYKGWWLSTGEPIAAEEWAAARAIRRGEASMDEEVEIECFDTTHKIILNSAVPLHDTQGRIVGAIIVNQDITSRKRAEMEREEMLREHDRLRIAAEEANRQKDDFIATLSHELRTPLNSVLGWTAILKRALPDAGASARAASAIERNAKIQAQLLNDTLEINRIVRGKLSLVEADVDLPSVVADVLESMRPDADEKGVALREHVDGRPALVRGDSVRLQQIVWNLLANALKFTPTGGSIEVRTQFSEEFVTISVQDSGAGIASELMPVLFERFRQGAGSLARPQLGLGLGLAIVKELVELHHGTITAESPGEGQGSTFTVRLPLVGRVKDQSA